MRGLILGHIHHYRPELLHARVKADGSFFKCSEAFVKKFVQQHLNWTPRAATRAAQKMPIDALTQCFRTAMRMVHAFSKGDIRHRGLCLNFDQTQVVAQDNRALTYDVKGKKQIDVIGKTEKRAWTCVVGVSDDGEVLPFQIIVQGATKDVHPPSTARQMNRAKKLGFEWDHNRSTYWSNQDTMRRYVSRFIVPFFARKKRELGYAVDQVCLVYLDVWSVHRSQEFRNWVRATYPWLWLIYVPGNLTGLFQVCDVGIQRPFKLAVRRAQLQDLVHATTRHLDRGGDETDFSLETRIGPLRSMSVGWFLAGYEAINNRDLVMRAWERCRVGDLNLSFDCLSGVEALRAYSRLRTTDRALWEELNMRDESEEPVALSEDIESEDELDIQDCPFEDPDADIDDAADDSALEPADLIAQLVSSEPCIDLAMQIDAPAEELDVELASFDFEKPDTEHYGRSKRRRKENKWYTDERDKVGPSSK
jgi:hypothetical protein